MTPVDYIGKRLSYNMRLFNLIPLWLFETPPSTSGVFYLYKITNPYIYLIWQMGLHME
jgi:hypothetical protein